MSLKHNRVNELKKELTSTEKVLHVLKRVLEVLKTGKTPIESIEIDAWSESFEVYFEGERLFEEVYYLTYW